MRMGKVGRAEDIRPVPVGFFVRRSGQQRQDLVRVLLEKAAHPLLVVFQLRVRKDDERSAFFPVEAVQQSLSVDPAGLVGFVGQLSEGVAVHGHVVLRIRFADQLFGRQFTQILDGGGFIALQQLLPGLERLFEQTEGMRRLGARDGGAFHHRSPEQALRERRGADRADGSRAGGFAGQRHLVRIPAEGGDIVAHPFQRLDLVQQAVVAGAAVLVLRRQLVQRKIAEYAEPVAHIDDDDAVSGQRLAVIVLIPGLAGLQGAAVDVYQDGELLSFLRAGGLPDVDVERILAHRRHPVVIQTDLVVVVADDLRERVIDGQIGGLHAHGREAVRL